MAKGLEKHQERVQALSLFGKDLTRRSGACCELCSVSGVPLKIFEVPPVPKEPDYDRCVFICESCVEQLERPKKIDPDHWRCLTETIWSEVPIVQVLAARILDHLSREHNWADRVLEEAYLDDEVIEKVKEQSL